MQVEITPLFLVLAAVIGLLVGLLVSSLFSSKDTKSKEGVDPAVKELSEQGFAEAATLWYSPGGKKVVTQLDGEYYHDLQSLSPEQKSRLNKLYGNWSDWMGKTQQVAVTAPVFMEPVNPAGIPPIQPILQPSVAEALKEVENPEETKQIEVEKPKTIAGQISLIIDQMLEGNPLKAKGIRLIENNRHGVDVFVGLEKFDGIDAIPYPEVQTLIRSAVAQWERETEAGKKPG